MRCRFDLRRAAASATALALLAALPAAAVAQNASSAPPAPVAAPSPAGSPAAPSGIDLARSRVDAMLRTGRADPSWFSSSFIAEISVNQVNTVLSGLLAMLGTYQSLEVTPAKFVAHFAKGSDDVLIHLDAQGKIDGLLFKPPALTSLDDSLRSLSGQPGTVSYVIVEEGRSERAALDASAPLAVGSAFKLAVLNALADEIRSGSRHWNDVVPLSTRWKTLPSGVLRTWPQNTPLTLATYAAEMISISDNMAADALISITGQRAIRPYADRNEPFLTTRQAFTMKSKEGTALGSAYAAAKTASARAAILRRVDRLRLPAIDDLSTKPQLAIEWHYDVRRLCRLMERVADLPLMAINPGVANASEFRHVAYKGGSDLGVINMTTMITTRRGTRLCFAATLNNPNKDVDQSAFALAYGAVLHRLGDF